jgi:hypothetical protein
MDYIKIEEVLDSYGLKIVENPEWLWVVLDAANHVLFGIKRDGSIEWPIGVPEPIMKEIEALKKRINELEAEISGLKK